MAKKTKNRVPKAVLKAEKLPPADTRTSGGTAERRGASAGIEDGRLLLSAEVDRPGTRVAGQ